jgi:hypothetical protein
MVLGWPLPKLLIYAHVSFVNLTPIWTPFKTKNGYQFSLKSENIEIFPILSAANLKMATMDKRGPNRGEVYKRNMCINYFLLASQILLLLTTGTLIMP